MNPKQSRIRRCLLLLAPIAYSAVFVWGCTSHGHAQRETPSIARPVGAISEFGFDSDDNQLSVAIENLIESRGIRLKLLSTPQVREQRGDREYTFKEVQTRFVLRVRSVDLDRCVPEGSRQMHFNISVTDFSERKRVFLMKGEFGCQNSVVQRFANWLSGQDVL